jgi:hypothetical protein
MREKRMATTPKWVTPRNLWRNFAAPAQSRGAKFCKFFVVFEAVFFALDAVAPGVGISYFSSDHLVEAYGSLVDVMVWCVALWFARARDAWRIIAQSHEALPANHPERKA